MGYEDLDHKNHAENQHAPAGANSLRPTKDECKVHLFADYPGTVSLSRFFRIQGAINLPVRTVHGFPLLTAIAGSANGEPRTVE